MKKLNLLLIGTLLGSTILFTGCGDDDEDNGTPGGGGNDDEVIVDANITSDVTWSSDKVYVLAGRIAVESGATLTIDAGTIIKGQAGSGANATALLIARGATLNANGTADAPIIMTSVADEIMPSDVAAGNFGSPNLDNDQNGLWGGLLVLGNAPISADAAEASIEGIPANDPNGRYGGSAADDNSGSITYVSVRHGGSNIGEGNEINGITLGGVGSGTTIENVEVVANQDDGIEWFGGTVNVTNALVWNAGDDAIDTDQEWAGTLDNFIVVQGSNSDHALELDGGEGTITNVKFTLQNGTCKGYIDEDTLGGEYADFRSKVQCIVNNVYFFNFGLSSDLELDNDEVSDNFKNGDITFTGLNFNVSHLGGNGNSTIGDILSDRSTAGDAFDNITAAEAKTVTSKEGGANASAFGWTWASQAGGLSSGF
jgi:hypothetical protein